jgi:poly-gamma-glutamate synthesis protein (capsule biosynthesis protein)
MVNISNQNLSIKASFVFLIVLSLVVFQESIETLFFPAQVLITISQIQEREVNLIFVGDVMLDRGVNFMIKKQGDYRFPFLKIAQDLKETDIVFGNLESVISDKGEKVGSIYSFRAKPKSLEGLVYAGFNVLSLANNHALDYGPEALKDSLQRLEKENISYVGAGSNEEEAFSPVIKKVNKTSVAFLAYTNLGSPYWTSRKNRLGIAWIDWQDFKKIGEDIENAKNQADILIVSLHSGNEYSKNPTQFQKEFSKLAIEAGADLVIGHHPHIVQPLEKYKEGWIVYSLGNFVFDQDFSKETMQGLMLKVIIKNDKISEVIPINIKINDFFQPEIER